MRFFAANFPRPDRRGFFVFCFLAPSPLSDFLAMIIRNNTSRQRAPCIVTQTDETRACTMRVVLADDHPLMLGGLRALLQAERGVEIAAAALDGATALEMIRAHEPEIAVLDITMPRLTGLEVLEALEADGLATRVVLLTGSVSDGQIATAVERGAWGLLLKESAPGTLIVCLRTVAAGQRWLPEELVAPAIRGAAEQRAKEVRPERVLTAREYEIAQLIARGLSNKHIARELAISEGTVKIHLHKIYDKLGNMNRTSLAVLMRTAEGPTRTYSG